MNQYIFSFKNISSSLFLYFLIHFALYLVVTVKSLTKIEIEKNNTSKINH